MTNLYIDIHALQSVPPSNLNRDDTGAPKTATYGGVKRHRVSSQSWKKAIRDYYSNHYGAESVRTKNVVSAIRNRAENIMPEVVNEDFDKAVADALAVAGLMKKGKKETDALTLLSYNQMDSVIKAVADEITEPKEIKNALMTGNSMDLALFGRMVAEKAELNVEAACQFAHSISTHAMENEYDYFTAVDEFTENDHAGASMIGDIEFTSSVLYRYASININKLRENFDESVDISEAVSRFVEAFAKSIPSGKQNTFAATTLPNNLLVLLREEPVSFIGAFESPIKSAPEEGGYAKASAKALFSYANKIHSTYNIKPKAVSILNLNGETSESLNGVKETVKGWL